jgi:hypothetical protein
MPAKHLFKHHTARINGNELHCLHDWSYDRQPDRPNDMQ